MRRPEQSQTSSSRGRVCGASSDLVDVLVDSRRSRRRDRPGRVDISQPEKRPGDAIAAGSHGPCELAVHGRRRNRGFDNEWRTKSTSSTQSTTSSSSSLPEGAASLVKRPGIRVNDIENLGELRGLETHVAESRSRRKKPP
jgi:hypothetical protein